MNLPEGHLEFWGSKTAAANCWSEMAHVGSWWSSFWPCRSASCKVKKRDRWQAQASATAVGSSWSLARKRIRNLRLVSWCVTKFNNHLLKTSKREGKKTNKQTNKKAGKFDNTRDSPWYWKWKTACWVHVLINRMKIVRKNWKIFKEDLTNVKFDYLIALQIPWASVKLMHSSSISSWTIWI